MDRDRSLRRWDGGLYRKGRYGDTNPVIMKEDDDQIGGTR